MDNLQKYLGNKERESPSPSLQAEPAALRDKARTFYDGLTRKVKYLQPKTHYALSRGEEQEQECIRKMQEDCLTLKENSHNCIGSALSRTKASEETQRIAYARKKLLDAIKDPYSGNMLSALQVLADVWRDYSHDGKIDACKVYSIRKRAIATEIRKAEEKILMETETPCMSVADLGFAVSQLSGLYNSIGQRLDTNKVWADAINHYAEKSPTLPLKQAMARHQDCFVIHGVPINSAVPSMQVNNYAMDRSRTYSWKELLENVLDNQLMLSCSTVNTKSKGTAFFSGLGVILSDGKLFSAGAGDNGSITYSNGVKILGSQTKRNIQQSLDDAVLNNGRKYNELIVGSQKVNGLYFCDSETRLFLPSEEEHDRAICELAQIALQRGLPLYKFGTGSGFTEVDAAQIAENRQVMQEAA